MGSVILPFSDGFENDGAGINPPPPWGSLSGGAGTVTTANAHAGLKSVVVSGGPFAAQSSVVDLGTSYTDFLQYEGWVNNDGGWGIIGFNEQVSDQAPSFNAVVFRTNRDVYFTSADGATGFNVPLASGLSSGWHYVRVQLNFQTLQGNVWLDGALVGNQLPISPKNVTYAGSNAFLRHVGIIHTMDSPVYLDDFSVAPFSVPSAVVGLPFSDGFETYGAGTNPPSPWGSLAAGPGTVTTAKAYEGSNSLVVTGGPYASQSSVVDLGTDYADRLEYEGWVNNDGGWGALGFHEQVSNQVPSFNAVVFKTNREVWFESADAVTGFHVALASGLSFGWHHIRVLLNFQTLQGNVWLDGALVGNQLPISPKNVTYGGSSALLRHVGIIHIMDSPVYLDDFSVACPHPGPFTYTFPAYGATEAPTSFPLVWSSSLDADSYDVYFGTSSNPPYVGRTTGTSYPLAGLSYLTTYYWKIVAKNTCGSSTQGTVWYFTTGCPAVGIPSNPSPANGATGVPTNPTLTWSGVSNADSYDVYFGTSSNPPYVGRTTTASYSLSGLSYGTLYYWRIVGKNNCSNSTSSPVWSFTTVSCPFTVLPLTQSFGGSGGTGTVTVTGGASCCWSASVHPGSWDWIGISSVATGCGNGTVAYFVLPNSTGAVRTGTLIVAGQTITIVQSAVCTYAISPGSGTFGAGAGPGSVAVTAGLGCSWTASTSPDSWDWIGIASGGSGTGNGMVNYFVLANKTGSTRTGALSIAGQTFAITQYDVCAYAISPASNAFGKNVGFGVVNVTADPGCQWSAGTSPESWDWLGINAGWTGTGNGTVTYYVLANSTGQNRTGTLTIAGRTFTVTQSGSATGACSAYAIFPTGENFGKDAGSGIVNVAADPGCFWLAWTDPTSWDWIGISSGWSGTGSETVSYYYSDRSSFVSF
jgi:hypothetical protein